VTQAQAFSISEALGMDQGCSQLVNLAGAEMSQDQSLWHRHLDDPWKGHSGYIMGRGPARPPQSSQCLPVKNNEFYSK
jgi:hypothetical protein